jgi:hypothetical protein
MCQLTLGEEGVPDARQSSGVSGATLAARGVDVVDRTTAEDMAWGLSKWVWEKC